MTSSLCAQPDGACLRVTFTSRSITVQQVSEVMKQFLRLSDHLQSSNKWSHIQETQRSFWKHFSYRFSPEEDVGILQPLCLCEVFRNILSVSTADCRSLVVLQTGRRPRPRRDGSSCCWMSWSYWSTSETRWSGTWTPRKKSKLLKNTGHKYKNTELHSRRSCGVRDVPKKLWT